ncbi:DUF790 family protein, partial [Microcoleus sp. Pol11C1]|uniref:DUF790 family protein n=1 Tax=unclassified Microcoleus TaxID=2642155 RepID=UPI002FD76123
IDVQPILHFFLYPLDNLHFFLTCHKWLKGGFCTWELISPLEPSELRQQVFALSARSTPSPQSTQLTLEKVATELSQDLNREVFFYEISTGFYAGLNENKILTG